MDTVTPDKISLLSSLIEESGRISILGHMHPDGDAAGSCAAMRHYLRSRGKDSVVILPTALPDNLKFIVPGDTVTGTENPALAEKLISGCDLLLCLDFNSASRAEPLGGVLAASPARKVLIDHHPDPEAQGFELCFSDTGVSSASELLYLIIKELDSLRGYAGPLPPKCAEALMAGMTTDTNNFSNSVFPTTLAMASDLLSQGVDRESLVDALMNCYRENRLRVIGYLLSEKLRIEGHTAYMVIRRDEMERFDIRDGDLEGIVNLPLSVAEVKISIFLREDDGYFRVSVRSKKGYSALEVARKWYCGGGHEQAAGGRLRFPGAIPSPDRAEDYVKEHLTR